MTKRVDANDLLKAGKLPGPDAAKPIRAASPAFVATPPADDWTGDPATPANDAPNPLGETAKASRKPVAEWISTDDIFAPLPPLVQVVPGLHVGRGRPTMLAGYGFSLKSMAAQQLALAAASGTKAWGHFSTGEPRRVRHFDHEQGNRATRARYQRLAAGHGITREQLGGRLEVTCFPSLYLNSPGAEDAYARELEGVDLAIVDALRGSVPGVDENDSAIGQYLNMVARVSEKTGTSFLFLHHAGKPKDGHDSDRRTVPRGSSAIFDACGTVLVISGSKDSDKLVSMEKSSADAEGAASEDFYLSIEDVLDDATAHKIGVRVLFKTKEQVDPPVSPDAERSTTDRSVLEFVRCNPDCSLRELRGGVGVKAQLVDAAVDRLSRTGRLRVTNGGSGKPSRHRIAE